MSKKYFINNFDTPIGNALFQELTRVAPDQEEPEKDSWTHMATHTDPNRTEKPKFLKKLLKRYKPKLSRKKMLEECDVYVYDLHNTDFKDIEYGVSIFNNTTLEEQKVFILISDVMVWSQTPRKVKVEEVKKSDEEDPEGGEKQEGEGENQEPVEEKEEPKEEDEENAEDKENQDENAEKEPGEEEKQVEEEEKPIEYAPFEEKDYAMRVPSSKYEKWKEMEELVLKLKEKENLKVIVVAAGVLYGHGEQTFHNHFKAAWLQQPQKLPYIGTGENLIPTIHIQDLVKFIIKIAENPVEQNYLFAIDNSDDRSQKAIVQAISKGVGSGEIESIQDPFEGVAEGQPVKHNDIITEDLVDVFKLDLDMKISELLQKGEEDAGGDDFGWFSEKGLCVNTRKVLKEFWDKHSLRPIQIMMNTLSYERSLSTSKFDWAAQKISEHYKIPIIKIQDLIKEAAETITDDILGQDLKEELEKIDAYLKENGPRPLDETLKVFYRAVKWRLQQNDCMNRGFILDSFCNFPEEANYIFYPQKKGKLDRVRPKPKKLKKKKKKVEEEDADKEAPKEENQEPKEEQEENNEDGENNGEGENQEEGEKEVIEGGQEGEGIEKKEEEEEYEEEEEPEEEKQEEQEEEVQEEEEEGGKPKVEVFFPESFIFIKKMANRSVKPNLQDQAEQNPELIQKSAMMEFFSERGHEVQVLDTDRKDEFEIFETLRIYIERAGRPYNYLQSETELKKDHETFYDKRDQQNQKDKEALIQEQEALKLSLKQAREKICAAQIEYVQQNEDEIDIIAKMPFRNYLLEYVVPELNEGLVEVSNFLPDDPVDFLAEYLYKKSFDFGQN